MARRKRPIFYTNIEPLDNNIEKIGLFTAENFATADRLNPIGQN
jgi:hypothetical protein